MKPIPPFLFALALTLSPACFAGLFSGEIDILRVEVTNSFFTVYSTSGPVNHENCEDADKVVF